MKQKSFWLKTLNVRPDEWWLVKKLFILQFLQGAGIAFFFTSSYALFLNKVGITELPYVFILSAFLLWITGYAYSVAEHKLTPGNLTVITTLFMAASILIFRLTYNEEIPNWFLYIMLAWFNVLYLLNNLEFWGIAAILFDVRQSKRLFGVISAGDIPAKFIGYSLALVTVEYIGTINLLWAGAICVLASIPFLQSITRSEKLMEAHEHKTKKHPLKHNSSKVKVLAKNFSGNVLIRRLALLTIIISTCFIIINYAFYAGVKEAYKDDVSLAKFIAFFLAFTRIAALIIKVILTSRLINRLGIIKSLLLTPIAMIILICLVLLTQHFSPGNKIIFYFFGITAIAVDILRSAINSPVFLTIMQPLPTHERLRAHTIVKGIMDPFASLITGILLLVVIKYQHGKDLTNLYYILLVMGGLWIIGIFRVNNQYLKTIIKTISSRYFNREDFSIKDTSTLNFLKEKIESGSEAEVINILKIADNKKNELSDELIFIALQHPSEKVKVEALSLIKEKNITAEKEILLPILNTANSSKIKASVLEMLCKMNVAGSYIQPWLDSKEPEVRNAAIIGILKYGEHGIKEEANNLLQQLTTSTDIKEQIAAATIAGELKNEQNSQRILFLLQSSDKNIRSTALAAAGKAGGPELLKESIELLDIDEKPVLQALFLAGEQAIPVIQSSINNVRTTDLQKEKLIQIAGKINGSQSHNLLINVLTLQAELYKPVIKALFRSHYIPSGLHRNIFENKALLLLDQSAGIIYMQNKLANQTEKYGVLINSLKIELTDLRDSLLHIFALLYGRDKINKVRSAYLTGHQTNIINAMEIIEMIVRKDMADKFNIIYEPGDIVNRINELHKVYPDQFFKNVEQILVQILSDGKYAYHYWTMACSLYTSKKQRHSIDALLIDKYTVAENQLLRETAEFAK